MLHQLGHPRELAKNYRGEDRYLISPLFFDDYIQTLKIVAVIFMGISLVFGTIDAVMNIDSQTIFGSIAEVFSKVISNAFNSVVTAFAWVTIIFWGIDTAARHHKLPEWKLKDLPDLPKPNTTKISRVESTIGLVLGTFFNAVFVVLLYRYIDVIGIYENTVMVQQLFNPLVTNPFIIYFVISAVVGIFVSTMKLQYGEWRISLAVFYTTYQILSTSLFLLFINAQGLFLPGVYSTIGNYFSQSSEVIRGYFGDAIQGITIFAIIMFAIDIIVTWVKTLKNKRA
ncbi:MAG: hypothetical protein C4537_02265 [Acholeplasma sp.]|nr:MAG: hypothetical protein C4537_02265 [Acholeplasma sp.]